MIEWGPREPARCYGSKLNLRIDVIAEQLACTGEEGFGSYEVAVVPHLFDGPWVWPPPCEAQLEQHHPHEPRKLRWRSRYEVNPGTLKHTLRPR